MVEYLLLLALVFIFGYITMTLPIAGFTRNGILTVRATLANVVRNGFITPGIVVETGTTGHPADPSRAKALHL